MYPIVGRCTPLWPVYIYIYIYIYIFKKKEQESSGAWEAWESLHFHKDSAKFNKHSAKLDVPSLDSDGSHSSTLSIQKL